MQLLLPGSGRPVEKNIVSQQISNFMHTKSNLPVVRRCGAVVVLKVGRDGSSLVQNWSGGRWAKPAPEQRLGAYWVTRVVPGCCNGVQSSDVVLERRTVTEQREPGLADQTPEN